MKILSLSRGHCLYISVPPHGALSPVKSEESITTNRQQQQKQQQQHETLDKGRNYAESELFALGLSKCGLDSLFAI